MKKIRSFSIYYMFLLTLFFTAVVSLIHGLNEERITVNEKIKLQRIILQVLDISLPAEADDRQALEIFNKRVASKEVDGNAIYIATSEDGHGIEGYAIDLHGPGFWGPVYGMMGIGPKLDRVLGIAFYKHTETPGLGGRITESWFMDQFKGKKIGDMQGETAPYFRLKPPGTAKVPHEVDAIAGATGTSRAVERLINEGLHRYLPLLAQLPPEPK
ncbi:MAG: FMN-binding protein [Deltaproteobacteria bacterium]|nr:FMN-binding protein [Deltaproteobacteria bacterium]